jgi:transposase
MTPVWSAPFDPDTGETLKGLAKRHDISRNLTPLWVVKYEAGEFDGDAEAVDRLQEYEARIAALERLVGKLTGAPS